MMKSKPILVLSLLALLALNLAHNFIERRLAPARRGLANAAAMSRAEQSTVLFRGHRVLPKPVTYAASAVYFVLFPLCLIALLTGAAVRSDAIALRVTVASLYVDYAVSSVLFILYPLPERWFYPESGASLLSNQWSYTFMAITRPLSGLTHCFPSFHTSAMVIATLVAFLYAMRYRYTLAVASVLVMLSTLLLGIHWLPDIPAGIGAGLVSVSIARLALRRVDPQAPRPRPREALLDASRAVTVPGTIPTPTVVSS